MEKKLMVLGAGFPQKNLIEAAKQLGYKTVVASIPGNYPGFAAADEISYTDITNPEEILKAATDFKIDGIATCCIDLGIRSLGYVCEKLGLVGLNADAADRCNNKQLMKRSFREHNVNTALFFEVKNDREIAEAMKSLSYPVVLKAVDLQGSNGVYICHNEEELNEAYEEVRELSKVDYFVLEEFISGIELGAQAFVYKGEILFILPHGDNTYMSHTAIPVGHYVPLDLTPEQKQSVITECEKAIRSLGLDNCAVNIDLIMKDGKVYLLELTGRAGATCLPELVSIYYGIDYYKMIVLLAMGEDPAIYFKQGEHGNVANASRMLFSPKSGKVRKISIPADFLNADDIYDLSLIIEEGDQVNEFTTAKDRIGQVIVKGSDYATCERRIQEVITGIQLDIQ